MIQPSRYAELFRAEAGELLTGLERELLRLEQDSRAPGAAEEALRALHTFKGMSAAMSFDPLTALAHALESLLQPLRAGDPVQREVTELAFAGVDALREGLPDGATMGAASRVGALAGRLLAMTQEGGRGSAGTPQAPRGRWAAPGLAAEGPPPPSPAGETVRVSRRLLDGLLAGAGELVVVLQRIEELRRQSEDPALAEAARRASKLARRLQAEALAARMVPASSVLERFPRAVRDHAHSAGKVVRLTLTGGDIELDRAVLERAAEPLMHMLHNAVDHGIETPDERQALGKPAVGSVRVDVSRSGEGVRIEVSDDGRGLDRERLRRAAAALGVLPERRLSEMADDEVDRLAAISGLSTAPVVSATSGRGVGLDAAHAAAARMGGSLTIRSEAGRGAAFTLRLPRTVAVVRALLLEDAGARYAIPLSCVAEVVRPPRSPYRSAGGRLEWRGSRLACLDLAAALGSAEADGGGPKGRDRAPEPALPRRAGASTGVDLVVVIEAGDAALGLRAARVVGTRDVVVRPLPPLRGVRLACGGATVLSDGSVALVLDAARLVDAGPRGIGRRAGVE
ncbi:MAG: chemotaxis protein CheA [Gemmatimonadota bacterium]